MLSKRLVHEKEEEHAQETLIREMTVLPLFFKWPPSHDAYLWWGTLELSRWEAI